MIAALLGELEGLVGAVRRGASVNVNNQSTKEHAVKLASRYFGDVRPAVIDRIGESPQVSVIDAGWQDLVRLAQGNNARRTYNSRLRLLRDQLRNLNVALLSLPADQQAGRSLFSSEEDTIAKTLAHLVPSAAASYRQGLLDLRTSERLSYRGTAVEFREALREVLDHLAPDDQVTSQEGFKLESGRTRPTMKQQVRFVLKSRGRNKSQRDASEKSVALVDERIGEVTRAVYDRASVATHVVETKAEVAQIKRFVDTVLFDILEITPP